MEEEQLQEHKLDFVRHSNENKKHQSVLVETHGIKAEFAYRELGLKDGAGQGKEFVTCSVSSNMVDSRE